MFPADPGLEGGAISAAFRSAEETGKMWVRGAIRLSAVSKNATTTRPYSPDDSANTFLTSRRPGKALFVEFDSNPIGLRAWESVRTRSKAHPIPSIGARLDGSQIPIESGCQSPSERASNLIQCPALESVECQSNPFRTRAQ